MGGKEIKMPVVISLIVLLVVVVGYFLWKGTGVDEPVPGPGQTLQNPYGVPLKNGANRQTPGNVRMGPHGPLGDH